MSSSQARVRDDWHDQLYRKMMVSNSGVMLLVRLHADLASKPLDFLRKIRDIRLDFDPVQVFSEDGRLSDTISWLVREFGKVNALKAIRQTAAEILELVPGEV